MHEIHTKLLSKIIKNFIKVIDYHKVLNDKIAFSFDGRAEQRDCKVIVPNFVMSHVQVQSKTNKKTMSRFNKLARSSLI